MMNWPCWEASLVQQQLQLCNPKDHIIIMLSIYITLRLFWQTAFPYYGYMMCFLYNYLLNSFLVDINCHNYAYYGLDVMFVMLCIPVYLIRA